MFILLFFAFLAGLFTVLSPCILPILPAILSAGAMGGRKRPLGIILGLILSFSFFTLTLTAIIQVTHIPANVLRYAAIAMIFLFGCIMLFPSFSNWFAKKTQPLADVGQKMQIVKSKGFIGGLVFGASLGLLWTPCAGPILATITALVATHAVSWDAVLLTVAYSIGAGIPLFLIAYGSQKIIASSRLLSKYSEVIRRIFGIIMILVALVLAFNWDMLFEQKLIQYLPQGLVENNPQLSKQLQKLRGETVLQGKAPELIGIVDWINSPPLTLNQLRGKVVLIDFWTYSCINCLRTIPYLKSWDETYKDKGLVIIGVHTPEFEFEKDLSNVKDAVERLGIKYPVALDNNYETWKAYHNQYWPAHYLIDQNGNIVMVHFGEGAYVETENAIRVLLNLSPLMKAEPVATLQPQTKETYLGLKRANSYNSQMVLIPHKEATYSYTGSLSADQIGLKGRWKVEDEYIEAIGNNSQIDLNFLGKQVYLVLAGKSTTALKVSLDGQVTRSFQVETDRKYDIVNTSYGRHNLSLTVPEGIKAYVFTFGVEN